MVVLALVSACGGAPAATEEPVAAATEAPPENAADCTNAAKFVTDVTIPDESGVNVGASFTKTWRVQNAGTCIWWSGYTVQHYSELALGAPPASPLPRTNPGETADISIDLVAPDTIGLYRGYFVIKNPKGLIMEIEGDSRISVVFNAVGVLSEGEATSVPGEAGDGLDFASCDFTLEATRIDGVFAAINTYRAEKNLAPYTMSQELTRAAQSHASDMACNELLGVHEGSDGSTPETRSTAAGYTGAEVTENVYGSYPPLSPEEVKEWWRLDQTDPAHNLNLISTEYTEIGIGYAFFNDFGYYVVVFGK